MIEKSVEVIINGHKYIFEVDDMNRITLKRYREDYKMWVVIYFNETRQPEISSDITNLLKDEYIAKITERLNRIEVGV